MMRDYSDMPASPVVMPRATTGDDRLDRVIEAIGVGVRLEVALSGADMTLAEFAAALVDQPGLSATLKGERLQLIVELHRAMMVAAREGKHLAAQALLAGAQKMEQEIDDAVIAAGDGDVGTMSGEDVEGQLSRYFSEGEG